MTEIRFIKGDARHLPIEDQSVQCIVTSPPYWGLRKYTGKQGAEPFGLELSIELYIQHTVEILRELRRVLRNDGVLFWNIGDSYSNSTVGPRDGGNLDQWENGGRRNPAAVPDHGIIRNSSLKPKNLCLIPSRVAIAAQSDGWWVRSMIVWTKPNPMPESCKDRPTNAYEYIIMLTKSARYFWNFEAVQEPTNGNAHARGNGVNPKARGNINVPSGWETGHGKHTAVAKFAKDKRDPAMYRNKQNPSFSGAVNKIVESRNMRNVWTFATQGYREAHFATFPEELPRRCILAATRVGDTVLDPFAGSGTVGRVAIELNRKVILNDLAYHDLSEKRTKNVQRLLI